MLFRGIRFRADLFYLHGFLKLIDYGENRRERVTLNLRLERVSRGRNAL